MKRMTKSRILCRVASKDGSSNRFLVPLHKLVPNVNLPDVDESWSLGDVFTFELQDDQKGGFDAKNATLFAQAESPRARMCIFIERFDLLPFHSPSVMKEVEEFIKKPGFDDLALIDMTDRAFITIDNLGSRDLDQALHICPKKKDGFILSYALADGAYYVKPQSALFQEALARGVTYYFPGFCLPMLPAAMSEGLVSLNPNVERRALVFVIELDKEAQVLDVKLKRAKIRSRAQLTYEGVQDYIDNPDGHELSGRDFTETLDLLASFGEKRILLGRKRGVVDYNRYEVAIEAPTKSNKKFGLYLEERCDVSRWNEQVSLLCNAEGAKFLRHGDVPVEHVQPVYRVHEKPSGEAFGHLRKFIQEFVSVHELDESVWLWQPEQSIAEYLDNLPMGAKRAAIERQVLITNQRSSFEAAPGPHHALAVSEYSRFTSPMREIVGIFTHKEACEMLGWQKQEGTDAEDEALREAVIEAANKAKMRHSQLTKEIFRLAVDDLFRCEMDVPFEERRVFVGTVLGMKETRLYVRLDSPPAEIKVYTDHLSEECGFKFKVSPGQAVAATEGDEFKLLAGEVVNLRVRGYDDRKDRWKLVPLLSKNE